MQDPGKLDVAQRARVLAQHVYRVTTAFPSQEQFGLTAQMRRAAVSIGSNIHEGCGCRGAKELIHFLHLALGSARELEFQLLVAVDLGLLPAETSTDLVEELDHAQRMLVRLIAAVQRTSSPR